MKVNQQHWDSSVTVKLAQFIPYIAEHEIVGWIDYTTDDRVAIERYGCVLERVHRSRRDTVGNHGNQNDVDEEKQIDDLEIIHVKKKPVAERSYHFADHHQFRSHLLSDAEKGERTNEPDLEIVSENNLRG